MEPERKRWKGCGCDSWLLRPVLSDQQSRDIELMQAFAAPIVDKKQTSRLVRELRGLYPLTALPHVKRVRPCTEPGSPHPLEVLVCLASDADAQERMASAGSLLPPDFPRDGLGEPFLVRVPARPPLTRPQFDTARKHWPTAFHEDKRVTDALKGQLFSPLQKAQMHTYMSTALTAAKAGREAGMEAVGAVVVDSAQDRIIAVSHDCRGRHPLHHAVMVCIDLVARSQGGGCYSYDQYPACRVVWPASGPQGPASGPPEPYICTGYHLYVTREPCVMCAMALVHSRIGRVFYGTPSADGALGTKYKLHTQKDLNHHFEVYRGILSRQCEDLEGNLEKKHFNE